MKPREGSERTHNNAAEFLKLVKDELAAKSTEIEAIKSEKGGKREKETPLKRLRRERVQILIDLPKRLERDLHLIDESDRVRLREVVDRLARMAQEELSKANHDDRFEESLERLMAPGRGRMIAILIKGFEERINKTLSPPAQKTSRRP